jgi:hypothetical protein
MLPLSSRACALEQDAALGEAKAVAATRSVVAGIGRLLQSSARPVLCL